MAVDLWERGFFVHSEKSRDLIGLIVDKVLMDSSSKKGRFIDFVAFSSICRVFLSRMFSCEISE